MTLKEFYLKIYQLEKYHSCDYVGIKLTDGTADTMAEPLSEICGIEDNKIYFYLANDKYSKATPTQILNQMEKILTDKGVNDFIKLLDYSILIIKGYEVDYEALDYDIFDIASIGSSIMEAEVTDLLSNKTISYIVKKIKYDIESNTLWIVDHRGYYLDFDMNHYEIKLRKEK